LVCTGILLAALGFLSFRTVTYWRDTSTLFARTLEINPRSHIAYVHMGVAAEESGRTREAISLYRKALELEPGYPIAGGNLGQIYLNEGKLNEAIELLRETVHRNLDYPYAAQSLAIALARRDTETPADAQHK